MRILVNALAARSGGAQTYLINIIPILVQKYSVEVLLVVYKEHQNLFEGSGVKIISPDHSSGNILARVLWEKYALPRLMVQEKVGLYYAPGGILGCTPPENVRSAAAFRNMLPFSPEEIARFSWGYNRIRYWLLRKGLIASFKKTDLTVFISNFAKQVIDGYVPKRMGGSVVIPHGIDEVFRSEQAPLNHLQLKIGNYFLYVSPLKPYKAQLEVVESWGQFCAESNFDFQLVFAGGFDQGYSKLVKQRINQLGLESSVILLGNVAHDDLPSLYQHAKAIIFASSCENCPNVLIESLNSGRPVLCSNIQPMPEIWRRCCRVLRPLSAGSISQVIESSGNG